MVKEAVPRDVVLVLMMMLADAVFFFQTASIMRMRTRLWNYDESPGYVFLFLQ